MIYGSHPVCYDDNLNNYLLTGDHPSGFHALHYIHSVEGPKALHAIIDLNGRSLGVVTTMGSSLMAARAMNQEVDLVYTPVPNANHLTIWISMVSLNNFMVATDHALHDKYCAQTTAAEHPEVVREVSVYPNPAN
jgi:hypothetical protein